ncbi:MAG: FAD-dependent oxidoreductase [Jatrophihabitantaceae bacterium]
MVVIGAGVVGAALADELTGLGWTDVTLLDQGELPAPGGSSSHAPGLVFQANSSKVMTEFASYTVSKLRDLSEAGQPCYLPVGGLEVATTPKRARELHRRHGWLTAWGVPAEVLDADQTAAAWPLLDPELVLGSLLVPSDGLVKAVRAVAAQATRAAGRGARILPRHRVLDIAVSGGRVRSVLTDQGEITADIVVCCAGIWGPLIAAKVGMSLPLTPMAHQLAWTGPLPALAGAATEASLPILRHQDQDLYYRQDFDRIGIGYYGHRPMPIRAEDIADWRPDAPEPSVQAFTTDDFAEAWRQTHRLLPATRKAELAAGINGLFSFTSDNLPLIGQSPTVAGFWVAEAVWVTHSAGVARAVAELLTDGYCSSFDLHECDLNRFDPHQLAPAYLLARDCQNFVEVYDIIHPLQPPETLRPIRTSPFYPRQNELGAVFYEASGWERPHWYEANAGLVAGRQLPRPDDWAARYWSPIVAAEAQRTRESVAMYDMSSLRRLELAGPGALDLLQSLTTAEQDKPVGSVTYCLLLDRDGGVRGDVTVARLAADRFQMGANSALDLDWLGRRLPPDGSVTLTDRTGGSCCIGLWGPNARKVLQAVTETDFSNEAMRYFRARQAYLGTVPVTALRLSYVGELGWELYTSADHGLRLWDLLWQSGQQHGIIAAGRGAFNSLRLEKGYRSFGTDLTFEHDPYEAGLGFAVRPDKGEFLGRAALLERRQRTTRSLCCLVLDDPNATVLGKEPVFADGDCVGYVTSASYGYTIGASIAYAWLPVRYAQVGARVQLGYFDQRLPGTVRAEPLFDPSMARLRA